MDDAVRRLTTGIGHRGAIYALVRGRRPEEILSASGDGMIAAWTLPSESDAVALAQAPAQLFTVLPLADAEGRVTQVLAGGLHGGVHLIDLDRGAEIRALDPLPSPVFDLLPADGGTVWVARGDGTLSVWDATTWRRVEALHVSAGSLRRFAPEPGGGRVAVGSSDHRIHLVERATGRTVQVLEGSGGSVFALAWAPDGRYLVSGGRDAKLRIWDASDDLAEVETLPAHLFTVNAIAFAPHGRLFATASRDKTVKLWSAADFRLLKVIERPRFPAHANSVNAICWSPDGGVLYSGSDDRNLIAWEVDTDALLPA